MTEHTADSGAFCWSELGTTNAERARRFYTAMFGWTTADQDMGEMGVYTLLRVGGSDIGGLYEMRGPTFADVPSHWTYYVAVANVDATAARAAELGGKVVMPPMDIPGTGRMALLNDPEGAAIAVFQAKGHPGARANPSTPGAFCWVELHTRNPGRAKSFYTALFGWKAKAGGADGPMQYTEWYAAAPNQPFGGMLRMQPEWGDMPPFWLGYVTVSDTDAAAERAQSLGAEVLCPPRDVPGVGRFAVLADPTGAAFAVIALDLACLSADGSTGAAADANAAPTGAAKRAKKKAKQSAMKPARNGAKKTAKKAATRNGKKPAKKPAKKSAKKSAKKPAKKSAKKAAAKTDAKKATKKATKKAAKKAKKTSAKAGKKGAGVKRGKQPARPASRGPRRRSR